MASAREFFFKVTTIFLIGCINYYLQPSGPVAPTERTFKMRTPYAVVIYMVINNINLGSNPIKI